MMNKMRIHLIAIGGAAMHNIALELKRNGHIVTGSDDEIYDPSKSRLEKAGLLPEKMGWNIRNITEDVDAIILGMHARPDNPELLRAQKMGLKIYSYPSFIAEQSKDKKRVVIAGSHGKTTTTAMILHVLKKLGHSFDFLVGAQLEGFDYMCQLSDAPLIVIEGDEYLSSPIDRRPKMLHYDPDIAVITGIAWDHINVFKTYEDYEMQFVKLVEGMGGESRLYCCQSAPVVEAMKKSKKLLDWSYYQGFEQTGAVLNHENEAYSLSIFGKHNMENLKAAYLVCKSLGVSTSQFFTSITDFTGAAKRLELIVESERSCLYKDFAHAPSKVKATVSAMKNRYSQRKLIAILELHTFSSLNEAFIDNYRNSLSSADECYVYFNEHVFEMKKMQVLSDDRVADAFDHPNLEIIHKPGEVVSIVNEGLNKEASILMMSSGNFGGFDFDSYK